MTFIHIALSVPNDMLRNVLRYVGLSLKPTRFHGRSYCRRKDSFCTVRFLYRCPLPQLPRDGTADSAFIWDQTAFGLCDNQREAVYSK